MRRRPSERSLDVLVLVPGHAWGGAERMASLVVEDLRTRGHRVRVASGRPNALRDSLADGPVSRVPLDPGRKWMIPVAISKLWGSDPDVLYTVHRWPALVARLARSQGRPPVVYHVQSLIAPRPFTWWGDHTIAVSKAVRDHAVRHGADPARISVVPNAPVRPPADPAAMRRIQGLLHDRLPTEIRAIYAGRLVPGKGVDVLIRTLVSIPALGLVVLGDGGRRGELERLARELGVNGRVWFAGWQDDAAPWMSAVDIGVVPSDTYPEGLPLSALELMAAGLPVVVSDRSGLPEAVDDGVDGLVVRRGDPAELAAALSRLVQDPALRARLGKAAIRTIEARFDPGVLSGRVAEIIEVTAQGRNL